MATLNKPYVRRNGILCLSAYCVCFVLTGCEVGKGEGEIFGTMQVPQCDLQGDYDLEASYFSAEDREERLDIVVQRGSAVQIRSDGMFIIVTDTNEVFKHWLNQPIAVDDEADSLVQMVFYLNESCDLKWGDTPVALSGVAGTITFEGIYAPEQNDNEEISATLSDVAFEGASSREEWSGTLGGYFKFTFSRGRPAQRFP